MVNVIEALKQKLNAKAKEIGFAPWEAKRLALLVIAVEAGVISIASVFQYIAENYWMPK